jgi:hypothetical protein
MNRRESLKAIGLGTLSTGLLLNACKDQPKEAKKQTEAKPEATEAIAPEADANRQPWEAERDKALLAQKFFTSAEMATITVLGDIIIPADKTSGSASDAGVPDFIEFIAKDMPEYQVQLRGGLRWLDLQCLNRFDSIFTECTPAQRLDVVDDIAYPDRATPRMRQGVAFFNLMRDLVATGFFTSKIGIEDIGYAGNQPNKWTGVPADVLKHYRMEGV